VEVRQVASPRIEETPVRVEPEEAGASWGAPVEAKPQHSEVEVTTVTPRYASKETVTLDSLSDAAELIVNDALETIVSEELAVLPGEGPAVRARSIKKLGSGVFYEVIAEYEDGWVERIVVRADKTSLYTKRTALYFGSTILTVAIEAVYVKGTLYYTVDARGASLLSSVEARIELEELLRGEE
jgi:hypothetical protein